MGKYFDLLSLGEVLLRLSPPDNELFSREGYFQKHIGGAELNVATGVSQLGLKTGIITKLPANDIGTYAKTMIRSWGVSDEYIVNDRSDAARLGLYYYENGSYPRKPSVVYDRRYSTINHLSMDELSSSMFSSARCFHTSGITLALSSQCRKTAIAMIRLFKEAGALISFDVNFRSNLWTGDEARKCIEQILPYVDIFFCSEDTAKLTFLKEGNVKDIMKSFTLDYSIRIVASTKRIVHSPKCHTFGSIIYDSKTEQYYEEEPYRNIEVVDRIGSGDAYISGVLYGLLSDYDNCQRALEIGNATGAIKNTIPGDILSFDLEKIEEVIWSHKNTDFSMEMKR